MASFPSCRECGNDLTTDEEQEQEVCAGCQENQEYVTKQDIQTWLKTVDDQTKICPMCMTVLLEVDGDKLYCPNCKKLRGRR